MTSRTCHFRHTFLEVSKWIINAIINTQHYYNKLYLLVSAVDPQESGVKCYYATARCHHSMHSYRKNSSQQGGWEALHPPPFQNVGGCISPPLTPVSSWWSYWIKKICFWLQLTSSCRLWRKQDARVRRSLSGWETGCSAECCTVSMKCWYSRTQRRRRKGL